jgi:uncharacterized protein (TIGR01777 family)
MSEDDPPGNDFMASVSVAWQQAVMNCELSGTRKVVLRTGIVLMQDSGYLPQMIKLAKIGAGGRIGKGHRWISWIHIQDLLHIVRYVIENDIEGPVNAAAPNPSQQKDFAAILNKHLDVLLAPAAPDFAVRLGAKLMGVEPEMALASQRAIPKRLLDHGFQFEFTQIEEAIEDLVHA